MCGDINMSGCCFGKSADGANHVVADDVTTGDLVTITEEAYQVTADHLITTGSAGVDVTSVFGDLQMVMDPATTYATLRSGTSAFGISLEALGSGKLIKLGTNGQLRIGIQDDRTTVYGDLYVTGNIINLPTNYTFFTPSLVSAAGSLGSITYTTQSGVYSSNGVVTMFQIELAGGYASSSSTHLEIQALPISTDAGYYISNSSISTIQNPMGTITHGTNIDLDNYAIAAYTPLTGTASFDIVNTGFYFTGAVSSYTPTLTVDAGTFTYIVQNGVYTTIGTAVLFFIEMNVTYSGVTTAGLKISLPSGNGTVNCISTSIQPIIGGTGIEEPTMLVMNNSSTATFVNQVLNTNTPLNGSGGFHLFISGCYLPTGTVFHPIIIAQNGTWIDTGATINAKYSVSGNLLVFTMTYSATVTSTSTEIRLSGLPIVQVVKGVVNDIYASGLNLPLALFGDAGTNSMTFYSKGLGANMTTSFSGRSVVLNITGYYIIQ
jgi:hypothetical protein